MGGSDDSGDRGTVPGNSGGGDEKELRTRTLDKTVDDNLLFYLQKIDVAAQRVSDVMID